MRGGLEQQVRPLHHPFRVARPVAVEGMLHPFGVGWSIASFYDTFQVNIGTAGRVVRSLAGERIVKHNRIGHPENFAARRKRPDGLADGWGKTSRQYAVVVGEFDIRSEEHTSELQSLRHLV